MQNKSCRIAIVGATGLVGRTMLEVLEESRINISRLLLFASKRSVGMTFKFKGDEIPVIDIETTDFQDIDIALFSAGKDVSVKYAPIASNNGCIVIDNGSYWRMHPEVPLVVPEVNPDALNQHHGIIANPNCSTIQLVVPLKLINSVYGLERVVVSTYQSVTGAGQKGLNQLQAELKGEQPEKRISKHQLLFNAVFHEIKEESGFSVEEIKMKNETRKILNLPNLPIAVTCVRLPILGGHGESVNLELEKPFNIDDIKNLLESGSGMVIMDDPSNEVYPTPELASGKNEVFVGRIRKDDSTKNGLHLWIVADNVRKGAATNAVQIAELIINGELFDFSPVDF